jgi:DNA-directed RNA polymerase specialized sigma24 family protein
VSVTFNDALGVLTRPTVDLMALDDALNALTRLDSRKSHVVEVRFFGGLSVEETAEVLKTSSETVMRDWKFAKVWPARELSGDGRSA